MLVLYKYVQYHTTAKSYTLPLENRGNSILVYYHLFRFVTYNLDLFNWMQLTSRIILISFGSWYFCYICYFLLKHYFCAMLGLYEEKS